MRKTLSSILAGLLLITLTNCASFARSGTQTVKITSTPPGASVYVDGRTIKTPATVELQGNSEYFVKAEKRGYKDSSTVIGSSTRMFQAVVGNILNGTLFVGMFIDFLGTGAAYDLDDELHIEMQRE